LRRLERLKTEFGEVAAREKRGLLRTLERGRLRAAGEVRRLHALLCFLRAYPDGPELLRRVEAMLSRFDRRGDLKRHRGALTDSGIAGTDIVYTFFAATALWLARRWPGNLSIEWKDVEEPERLRRFLPLLALPTEQPGLDEYESIPVKEWLARFKGPAETDASFLIRRFAALGRGSRQWEVFYEDLGLPLRLAPGVGTPAQTRAKYPKLPVVFQTGPLRRSRPRLAADVLQPPVSVRFLAPAEGAKLIDLARDSMVTRSRDLDAFAYADRNDVRLIDCGEGLQFACMGALPERRLLLEAVYGFLTLKNGVPIGYALASALFNSSEVAYNVFETYRGAEAAWVYGRVLATVRHLFRVDSFTVYPYQLGHQNDEGLESGAWWFYQKLGFRPRDRGLIRLMNAELRRMKARPAHRSSRSTLKRLVSKNVYYFIGKSRQDVIGILPLGNVGLALSRYLGERFGSAREEARRACTREAAKRLNLRSLRGFSPGERLAWERWSPLLLLIRGVEGWSREEKRELVEIVRAKGGRRESDFVARFDRHPKLRRALLRLTLSFSPRNFA
jgi:hypothetical protein